MFCLVQIHELDLKLFQPLIQQDSTCYKRFYSSFPPRNKAQILIFLLRGKGRCPWLDPFGVSLVEPHSWAVQVQFPRQTWRSISLAPSATIKPTKILTSKAKRNEPIPNHTAIISTKTKCDFVPLRRRHRFCFA